jgi:hypothetical protein
MADEPTLQEQFETALAELNPMQRKFVHEYLHDFHQRNAAIRAGYSEKTADVQASQLLRKLKIRTAVDLGFQFAAMPAPEVIARLSEEARADMSDFLRVDEEEITLTWSLLAIPEDEDGEIDLAGTTVRLAMQENVQPTDRILHTATITRSVARLDLLEAGRRGKLSLVKEYTIDEKGNQKIKLVDAHAARVELAKIHGLLVDRRELTGKDGAPLFPDFEKALQKAYASDEPDNP